MSLSRAFTTRRMRSSNELAADSSASLPRHSNTNGKGPVLRHKISAPIRLIHTTNMLSYNAPDLPRPGRSSSTKTSTSRSDEESDAATAETTPPTSPDVASGEPLSPEPNHLTSYFKAPAKTMDLSGADRTAPPPAIPKRSPSHTKKNSYDAIARSRSMSRLSRDSEHSLATRAAQTFSRPPSTSTRASSSSHSSAPQAVQKPAALPQQHQHQHQHQHQQHPFGHELAQVTELAEEYSAASHLDTIDEEQMYLDSRGLVRLTADDYLGAIRGLSTSFFPEMLHVAKAPAPLWI